MEWYITIYQHDHLLHCKKKNPNGEWWTQVVRLLGIGKHIIPYANFHDHRGERFILWIAFDNPKDSTIFCPWSAPNPQRVSFQSCHGCWSFRRKTRCEPPFQQFTAGYLIWRFPKMGVPPTHEKIDHLNIESHHVWGSPVSRNPQYEGFLKWGYPSIWAFSTINHPTLRVTPILRKPQDVLGF